MYTPSGVPAGSKIFPVGSIVDPGSGLLINVSHVNVSVIPEPKTAVWFK